MGSRVRTAWRKDRCPSVAYGLPWGLLARSAVALHAGHRPGLGWRLGQPGVEQTRMDAVSGVYLLGAGTGCVEGAGAHLLCGLPVAPRHVCARHRVVGRWRAVGCSALSPRGWGKCVMPGWA